MYLFFISFKIVTWILSEIYYSTTHLVLYVLIEINLLFSKSRDNQFLKDILALMKVKFNKYF